MARRTRKKTKPREFTEILLRLATRRSDTKLLRSEKGMSMPESGEVHVGLRFVYVVFVLVVVVVVVVVVANCY